MAGPMSIPGGGYARYTPSTSWKVQPLCKVQPPWRCTPKKLQTSKRTFPVLTPSGGHCSGQCAGMVSSYYHLQHICRKYMFSQASVILFTGGGVYNSMHWGQHPPPLGRHPLCRHPPADTQLGRHPLPLGRPPTRADTPPGQIPPADTPRADTLPPPPDGHCNGRCASYWNAFLLINMTFHLKDFNYQRVLLCIMGY